MASLVSTTVNGDLKVTGSSNLFFEGSASSNTYEPGTRIYGVGVTLTGGAYTSVFEYTVPGGLAGNFRFFVKGTTGNVVIPTQVDVLLNHSKDITIKSQTGNYTPLHVKVLTNNNEDCLVQLKADTSGNANVTVYIDVIAFGDGSVSFSSFGSYTGTSLEHKCNFGFSFSAIDNTNASKFVMDGGNADGGRLGIGTNSPAQPLDVLGKVSINSDGTLNWGAAKDYGRLTWSSTNSRAIVRGESGKNLSLGANGTQDYVFIKTDGNVGIGTTGPEARLDLHAGNMLIGDSYLDHHSSNDNYGLQIKSIDATQVALELRSNGGGNAAGTWRATLYAAAQYYGFLDSAWGYWDIKKNVNGALQIDQGSGLETVLTTATGMSSSTAWANMGAGTRTNYTLKFQPPASSYAGFQFNGTNGSNAGYFLIRGTSDDGVYTAEGITLVADQGWLTLAQRTAASKGVRIMTGSGSSSDVHVRINVSTAGDIVLGVPTNSLGTATTTTLKGYSVQYDAGGAGERLSNTGFLTWHTGGSWTGNERMWAFTNADNMGGGGGPRFTLLRGSNNSTVPTLGNSGSLGTNTLRTCFWTKDGDFYNSGNIGIGAESPIGDLMISRGSSAGAEIQFHGTDTAYHRLGIRKTGSRLDMGEYNNSGDTLTPILTVDGDGDSVGIGTTNPNQKLHVYNGRIAVTNGYNIGSVDGNTGMYVTQGTDVRLQVANTHMLTLTTGALYPAANGTKDLGLSGNRWNNVYSEAGNFSGNLTLAGDNASRFYFGNKLAIEGQISNNNLDLGESFANIRLRSSSDVFPTNSVNLGTSSSRWSTIYGAAGNFSGTVTATTFSGTLSGTADKSNMVTGSAFATTGSPGSVLEYQQASGQTDTKLAPTTDWYNTIRMGHGNPYSYYSNTIAMQMTGTGAGQIRTQLIANNNAQGWRTVWDSGNDGSGSGLDADKLDGLDYTHFAYRASGGTGYYIVSSWLQFSGTYGPYWNAGTGAGWHIYPASTDSMRWRAAGGGVRSNLRLDVGATNYGNLCASTTMGYGLRKAGVTLSTDSDWDLLINTDGNVGIGTTNPGELLDVGGDANEAAFIGKARIGMMGYAGYAAFGHRALGNVAAKYAVLQDANGGSYFNAASGQTVSFRIANSDQMVLSLGQLKFPDSKKIIMGTGNDLEIYHDGSNSYIKEASTGDIILDTNSNIRLKSSTEHLLNAAANGAVELYYNNAKTFQTTASGVKLSQSAGYLFGGDDEILAGQDSGGYYFATGAGQNVSKPIFIGDNASYIKFKTGDSERIRIDGSGNVGINITNPTYKLHVSATSTTLAMFDGGSANNWVAINSANGYSAGVKYLNAGTAKWFVGHYNGAPGGFSFYDAGNAAVQLYVEEGGNVGIGTTDPGFKLHVAGGDVRLTTYSNSVYIGSTRLLGYDSSTAGNLWVIGGSGGASGSCRVTLGTGWNWDTSCDFHYAPGTAGAGNGILTIGQQSKNNANYSHGITRFYTKGAERVRIDADGDVGIGTNSPDYKLHVQDTASPTIRIQDSTNNSKLDLRAEDSAVLIRSTGNHPMRFDVNQTERMRITTDGNIGIGEDVPLAKLQIEGTDIILNTEGSNASKYFYMRYVGAGNTARIRTDGEMTFETGGGSTEQMRITNGGSVGIGTTQPSQKLDVNGNTELNGSVNIVGGGWLSFDGEQGLRKSGSWLYLADGGFTSGLYTRIKIRVDGYDVSPYQNTASVTSATTLGISTKRWYNIYSQAGNFSGTVTAGAIALGAGDLTTTGNISGNGSGLSALNASNIGSGTINVARLGSGATSSKFLRGDNTWQTVSSGSNPNNATITLSAGTNLSGGGSFTTDQSSNATITFNMAAGGFGAGTYGSTSDSSKIDQITLDAYGRVTNITTGGTGSGSMSGWYWGANTSTATYISNSETVRIKAGTNISVSRSGNDITITNTASGGSGDITAVTAGNGLSGGGTSGSVTLNITGLNSSGYGSTAMKHITVGAGTAQTLSNGISFSQSGGISISASGSEVSFSSSSASDYRLKKNVTDFNSESWTKVKSVSCRKFDFDAEKFAQAMQDDYTIPRPASYGGRIGFIAHELEALGIDGAVEGEKDGVDENGIPIYQKVSYTTLVPVLWGALNEAIRKIEILESKVQALEDSS